MRVQIPKPLERGVFLWSKGGENMLEKSITIQDLRQSFDQIRNEANQNPCYMQEGLRYMREGIGLFLDENADQVNDPFWLSTSLRFEPRDVSLSHIRYSSMQEADPGQNGWYRTVQKKVSSPVEVMAQGAKIWFDNFPILLNSIEAKLK